MQIFHQNRPTFLQKSKILRTSCAQVLSSPEAHASCSRVYDLQVLSGTKLLRISGKTAPLLAFCLLKCMLSRQNAKNHRSANLQARI